MYLIIPEQILKEDTPKLCEECGHTDLEYHMYKGYHCENCGWMNEEMPQYEKSSMKVSTQSNKENKPVKIIESSNHLKTKFYKTHLMYVFMVLGMTIGRSIGTKMNATTPEKAGMYVFILSIVFFFLGGSLGYVISSGIDSIAARKTGRIVCKWIAGIVGFFIYCILLASITK